VTEFLGKLLLFEDIDEDFKISNVEIIDINEEQVIHRRVSPADSFDTSVSNAVHSEKMRSVSIIENSILSHPPPVSLAIDRARTSEVNTIRVMDLPETNARTVI